MSIQIKILILLPLFIVLLSNACSKEMQSNVSFNSTSSISDYVPPESPAPYTPGSSYFSNYTLPTNSKLVQLRDDFIPMIHPSNIDNRYSTAVFGSAREMINYTTIPVSFSRVELNSSYLNDNNKLLTHLLIQKNGSSIKKAPLAIVLNPLYSGEFTGQMNRYLKFFGDKGYHVAIFMNTWSPDVTTKNPKFMVGDIWKEAEMHIEAIDKVIAQQIGPSNVSGTTLLGLSYGAFLSAVVKAYDSRRNAPVIDGPTVVLNPPHDILKSLRNLDRQTKEASASIASCFFESSVFSLLSEAINKSDYNQTNINEQCAKFVLAYAGFKVTLSMAVSNLNQSKNLGLSLSEIASVTYEGYMQDIAKLKPTAAETDLGYWMSESKKRGYDRFITLAASDDNINEGYSLRSNPYYSFTNSNSIELSTSGHTGFRAGKSRNPACSNDWTTCLLNAIY